MNDFTTVDLVAEAHALVRKLQKLQRDEVTGVPVERQYKVSNALDDACRRLERRERTRVLTTTLAQYRVQHSADEYGDAAAKLDKLHDDFLYANYRAYDVYDMEDRHANAAAGGARYHYRQAKTRALAEVALQKFYAMQETER